MNVLLDENCPQFSKLEKFNENGQTYEDKIKKFESRMEAMKINHPNDIKK